jgi:ABC-type branched-subunit amino acid transport system ATPase component
VALLELDGVEKRFRGLVALKGVTFGVDEGEIVALVGPNGAGKTTLLKAIGGMHAPTAGRIAFAGRDVAGRAPHRSRHAGIAMVMQTPRAFETLTVLENAVIGAMFGGERASEREATGRAHEMLAFVGLDDRARDEVGALNLHQLRFLEIARQLASRPRLVLLDEVMAGLNDTEIASSIAMVRRIRAEWGVTVIWVEHVMKAVISLAERVLVLNFGQLIADGEPAAVMTEPAVVEAYLGGRGLGAA